MFYGKIEEKKMKENIDCAWTKKECYRIIKKYLENHGQKCTLEKAKEEYEKIANFNYKYSRDYATFYSKMCSDIAYFINSNKDFEKNKNNC